MFAQKKSESINDIIQSCMTNYDCCNCHIPIMELNVYNNYYCTECYAEIDKRDVLKEDLYLNNHAFIMCVINNPLIAKKLIIKCLIKEGNGDDIVYNKKIIQQCLDNIQTYNGYNGYNNTNWTRQYNRYNNNNNNNV